MICSAVQNLVNYGLKTKLIMPVDVYVVRNRLMDILALTEWTEQAVCESVGKIDEILEPLVRYACDKGIIADTANNRDLFDTKLMGALTPMPREIVGRFEKLRRENPKASTDWYFNLSKDLNYVRSGRIAKDLKWTYECEYGVLDITVNRSKPEKDPRDIAAAKNQKTSAYPKCQLCPENAGFAGNAGHPARQNLCPIPLEVNGSEWFLQYSPYGYYNEHCIVFNSKHIPMKIDSEVFGKLFDIIDIFPHYFVGSNADLPIVGGSILSHEHFQGGGYKFAMEKAPVETEFEITGFSNVKAGIVKWPMSVIRLSSENRASLAKCCDLILRLWRDYSDPSVDIFAETDGVPHNTITPIARKRNGSYECDLVLRNNLTTEDRPLGLYHPKPSLHHIKKENIGLIEVMGLAVLPARLADEIVMLEKAMLSGEDLFSSDSLGNHAEWAAEILDNHPDFSSDNARSILENEIGKVFLEVLCDAGVYKRTEDGKKAFERFIDNIV